MGAYTTEDIEFLKTLCDGHTHVVPIDNICLAYRLHDSGLVFCVCGGWPHLYASITFAGRKELSRQ